MGVSPVRLRRFLSAEVELDEPQSFSIVDLGDVAGDANNGIPLLAGMGSTAASDGDAFQPQWSAQRLDAARYRPLLCPWSYGIGGRGLYGHILRRSQDPRPGSFVLVSSGFLLLDHWFRLRRKQRRYPVQPRRTTYGTGPLDRFCSGCDHRSGCD